MNQRDEAMFFDGVCAGLVAAHIFITGECLSPDAAAKFTCEFLENNWFKLLEAQQDLAGDILRDEERQKVLSVLGITHEQ